MTDRWEYKVLALDCRDATENVQAKLNNYGSNGWELVAVARYSFEAIAYLKRRSQNTTQEKT